MKIHPDLPDSFEHLTIKEQRFIPALVATGNQAEAARQAGYSQKYTNEIGSQNCAKLHIQRALADYLAENSVTDAFLAKKLVHLLNAKTQSVKYDPIDKWQYSAKRDDHATQLSALDMAFRLKGAYPKEAKDSSQYTLIIQEGHMQVNQGGAEANRTDVGPFQIEE